MHPDRITYRNNNNSRQSDLNHNKLELCQEILSLTAGAVITFHSIMANLRHAESIRHGLLIKSNFTPNCLMKT